MQCFEGSTASRILPERCFTVSLDNQDTEVWRGLDWFKHYDKIKHGEKATLFQIDDKSFVLIFPLG